MPVEDSLKLSFTSSNDWDRNRYNEISPFYNAFADQDDPSFTSALEANTHPRPLHRRTGSESDSDHSRMIARRLSSHSIRHSRSHTDDSLSEYHPLRSANKASCSDAGVTRPHLNRMLSGMDATGDNADGTNVISPTKHSGKSSKATEEKTVIVHEVSSSDSLPGVALKYGISLAELRRANHLWASDSIHLRKVLYIPLDKTARSQRLTAVSKLSAEDEEHLPEGIHDQPDIRRVPTSQLSFFPPPATPDALPRSTVDSKVVKHSDVNNNGFYTITSRTFSSLLSALPVPSTRNTFITRLSFESGSPSTSEDHDHELGDIPLSESPGKSVPETQLRRSHSHRSLHSQGDQKTSPDIFSSKTSRISTNTSDLGVYRRPPVPSAYEAARPHSVIRDVQLEPSPIMELPRRPSTGGRTSRRRENKASLSMDRDGSAR